MTRKQTNRARITLVAVDLAALSEQDYYSLDSDLKHSWDGIAIDLLNHIDAYDEAVSR